MNWWQSWVPKTYWWAWGVKPSLSRLITKKSYCRTNVQKWMLDMIESCLSHRPDADQSVYPCWSQKHLKLPCEHQNWLMRQWRRWPGLKQQTFILHYVVGQVHVRCSTGEEIAPDSTIGRRQARNTRGPTQY